MAKTAKHTPGPWRYSGLLARIPTAIMHPGGAIQIAHALMGRDLDGAEVDAEEADANARLIAQAPTLLNIVEGMLQDFEPYVADEEDEDIRERNQAWLDAARAAIAAAQS